MKLRQMTRAEMEVQSAKIGIPHPYKVQEMGIIHFPSPAYTSLWLIEDEEIKDEHRL